MDLGAPSHNNVSLDPLIQAESQLQEILDDGTCIIKTKEGEDRIQEALFVSIYPPLNSHSHGKSPFFLVNIFKVVDFPRLYVKFTGVYYFVLRGNHTGIVGKHLLTRGTCAVCHRRGLAGTWPE